MKHIFATLLSAFLLILTLTSAEEKKPIKIFMIGDSTMANKSLTGNNQERGWGQMLSAFFTDDVVIDNRAHNGRSTKSFIDGGEWQAVYDAIQPGDYVIIQFGHNDEKINSPERYTQPGTTFDDNLRRFVLETREKGGIPVLMDAIARRSFFVNENAAEEDDLFGKGTTQQKEGKTLIETHIITREDGTIDDYLDSPRFVSEELEVPFVEMNKISKELIESYGNEGSKQLFCWLPANTYAACPQGREDNTHLCLAGARALCSLAVDALGEAVPALKPFIRHYDLVVAQDGSGDFFTIQEAINAIPDYNSEEITILVQPGTYYEKVVIPESKSHITMIAKSEGKSIISYDDYASKKSTLTGRTKGTSGSASIYIYAPWFEAVGITFENTASRKSWQESQKVMGQGVAALVASDKVVFRRCRFLGHQDTLYAYGMKSDPKTNEEKQESHLIKHFSQLQSRQYYEDCYIEGTVDYIFGWAIAVFNRCELHSLGRGYITAAATPENQDYGFVFHNCTVTAEPDVTTYLGRPWRNYAQTVFLNCELSEAVSPDGWEVWTNKETGHDGSSTAFYAEHKSTGAGANIEKRVRWSHQLNGLESLRYNIPFILKGKDGWAPTLTPAPEKSQQTAEETSDNTHIQ